MSYVNPTGGDHPRDVLAAYALDAVDDAERRAIESHLATCVSCSRELAAHEEVLSRMIVDERPPASVWDRIVQETQPQGGAGVQAPSADHQPYPRDDVAPLTSLDSARDRRDHERARPPRRFARVLAVAAAAVVVAGVGGAVVSEMGGDDESPEVAVGVIESPEGTEIARVTQDDDGTQVELSGAEPLPGDREYQLWSTGGGAIESLGVLGDGSDPEVEVSLPEDTTQVAISIEPAGGSEQPTTTPIGQGEVSLPA